MALPVHQALLQLTVVDGTSVGEAVVMSGIAEEFPETDLATLDFGVWGKVVDKSLLVQEGDRIEIYRPLPVDPREARRQIAVEGGVMGGQLPQGEEE